MGVVMLAWGLRAWTAEKAGAEPKEPVARLQEDFRKLSFGMFIHYNMATYTGEVVHRLSALVRQTTVASPRTISDEILLIRSTSAPPTRSAYPSTETSG